MLETKTIFLFVCFFISGGKHDIKLVALEILTWESMGTAPSGTVRMVSYPGDHPTSCEHTLLTMKNDPLLLRVKKSLLAECEQFWFPWVDVSQMKPLASDFS